MRVLNRGCIVLAASTLACGDLTPDIYIDRPADDPTAPSAPDSPVVGSPPTSDPRPLPAADRPSDGGAPRFDWAVEAIGQLPELLVPGQSADITFELRNEGEDAAPPTSVSIRLESGAPLGRLGQRRFELARISVPQLEADEAYRETVDVFIRTAVSPATYGLSTRVDPDDVHPETDESNNQWLHGSTRVSPIVLSQDRVNFGNGLAPGCTGLERVTVRNLSSQTVRFATTEPALAEFQLVRGPGLLAPGQTSVLQVHYRPQSEGVHTDRIEMTVDDQRGLPLSVELIGQSVDFPIRNETTEQAAGPSIDMLLVVADGPDMDEEWNELARFAPQVIDRLRDQEVAFRIAVARTGAAELLVGPVVDHRQPDATQHLLELLQRGAAESANAGENRELFATADRLIEGPLELRREAGLALVFLSNTDDASPAPADCMAGRPVEACYRQRFIDAKSGLGGVHQVAVHGIFEDGSPSCGQDQAERLWHLASDLGGTINSVCEEDAFTALWQFNDARFGMPVDFTLQGTPIPDTAGVKVDGARVPAYDFLRAENVWWINDRTLHFIHGRQPTAAQSIDIEYLVRCEL
ncbi:MAG: CARDB domain-containing protein [Myxococcota bacterium]